MEFTDIELASGAELARSGGEGVDSVEKAAAGLRALEKGYGVARGMVEREEDRLLRSGTVEREAQWRAWSLRQ
jgi:hypothetical protein